MSEISLSLSLFLSLSLSLSLQNYVAQETHVLQGILHHSGISLATSQLINHFQNNKTSSHFPVS